MSSTKIYTAEAVTSGHPDKFCDLVSDTVLDACLREYPDARVACETFATKGLIVIGGEITTTAEVDYKAVLQSAAETAGYELSGTDWTVAVHAQSPDIAMGVDGTQDQTLDGASRSQGAGDQGIMIGYACDETADFLPLEYAYARAITDRLEVVRKDGIIQGIGSDGKVQVSAEFKDETFSKFSKIIVSVQYNAEKDLEDLRDEIWEKVIGFVFAAFNLDATEILINPTGRFVVGGIDADTGLTGRKIVADAYGPRIQVGGGAFSGKDPSKVDRSGAYFARYVAKNIVAGGLAKECTVQVAYAIGKAEPLAVRVDTHGTGVVDDDIIRDAVLAAFDFRPAGIIRTLDLKKPIYAATATSGHFGKSGFSWEQTDKISELLKAVFG